MMASPVAALLPGRARASNLPVVKNENESVTDVNRLGDIIHDWNEVKRRGKVFQRKIELCDETLRDGIQSPSVVDPSIEPKLEIVELQDKLGITTADVGLPGAGARAVEDVTRLVKHIRDQRLKIIPNCAARTVV